MAPRAPVRTGTIPMTFVRSIPLATIEQDVYPDIGNIIDVGARDHDQRGWCRKRVDRGWCRDSNPYAYLRLAQRGQTGEGDKEKTRSEPISCLCHENLLVIYWGSRRPLPELSSRSPPPRTTEVVTFLQISVVLASIISFYGSYGNS
jgi:hypothetical protein